MNLQVHQMPKGSAEQKRYLSTNVFAPRGFPGGLVVKNPPANTGELRDTGLIPGLGRSPGGRHGNPLQHSCLENPMDRGAWRAAVHRVAKSRTRLKRLSGCRRARTRAHTHTHTLHAIKDHVCFVYHSSHCA